MADRQESTSGTEETQSEDQTIELNCDDTTSTPLDHSWRVFYTPSIAKGVQASNEEFESALRDIGSFDTVEVCRNIFFFNALFHAHFLCPQSFWEYWNLLFEHSSQKAGVIRIFRDGIHPTWDDKNNENGGKFVCFQSFPFHFLILLTEGSSYLQPSCTNSPFLRHWNAFLGYHLLSR